MQKNFGIAAVWHFFATCHGKGPMGGVLKRNALKFEYTKGKVGSAMFKTWSTWFMDGPQVELNVAPSL